MTIATASPIPRCMTTQTRAPQRPRGTQDMIGEQAARFDHVVETFNRVRKLYGFGRVEVPVFEATSVFSRSLGETTDVVSKEMYSFEDRGGDSLTLRPEFTAGIARAYIENGWQQHAPLKLATWGPLFRYERPQKGRFRQFHQLDAEVIGAAEPAADVEVIALGQQVLDELGVAGDVVLQLNTMGDAISREAWRTGLVEYFHDFFHELSFDSVQRMVNNPLRILDSKAEQDQAVVTNAPKIDEFLNEESRDFFARLTSGLDSAGVRWERDRKLVRGLDYYRHTVFEFVTQALGSQGTVIGGGRYDGLLGAMGGPETPAVGWAGGIERLAMLVEAPQKNTPEVTVIPFVPDFELAAQGIVLSLRRNGIRADIAYRGSEKRRREIAIKNESGSRLIVAAREGGHMVTINEINSFSAADTILRDRLLSALSNDYNVYRREREPESNLRFDAILWRKSDALA